MAGGAAAEAGLGEVGADARVNMGLIGAIVAVATIGGFMFGYDSGVINGTQEGLEKSFHLSGLGTGLNVGAILLGCAAGAFAAGRLADVYGRRAILVASAVLFLLSALAAGAAPSSAIFIVARVIGGLGVGAASVLSPVYISEVTPASMRGRLSSVQQVMIITGLTGAFVVNYLLALWAGGSTAVLWGFPAWRWMFWMQAGPAALFLASLSIIPESPRFLVSKGSEAHAERVLARLFGAGEARRKTTEIAASLAAFQHRPRFSDLLENGRLRLVVWAGLGLAVFQQLVGINVIFYYGAVLWRSVGFSEGDALKINILSGSLSILACLGAIAVIDRIGRRPLLLVGSAGMAATLAIVAYAFSTAVHVAGGSPQLPGSWGLIALLAANGYVVFFNFSWGPVMWVMLGEMFPNQMRGSALAVAGLAQWGANFLISVSFPSLASGVGLAATYGFYAASAAASFLFVRALVPETKGRELEQMEG